jgi:hypothetical protein
MKPLGTPFRLPSDCLGTKDIQSALAEFPRIAPFLWFDNNAEDAVNFYLSVFQNSRRLEVQHNTGGAPGPAGYSPACPT